MTTEEFKDLVLSFPETRENPHFDRLAFKVEGKRNFATLHEKTASANIKLPVIEQKVFCDYGKEAIYAVDNKWGFQGWTTFDIEKAPKELIFDALNTAYQDVIKPKAKKK